MTHIGIALKSPDGLAPHDIHLDSNNELAIVTDAEAVGQHARQRLMTHHGEWFLDNECGVPWLDDILGRQYDPALAEAVIKAEIVQTHGVTEITSFSASFNPRRRELGAYSISVRTTYDVEVSL